MYSGHGSHILDGKPPTRESIHVFLFFLIQWDLCAYGWLSAWGSIWCVLILTGRLTVTHPGRQQTDSHSDRHSMCHIQASRLTVTRITTVNVDANNPTNWIQCIPSSLVGGVATPCMASSIIHPITRLTTLRDSPLFFFEFMIRRHACNSVTCGAYGPLQSVTACQSKAKARTNCRGCDM